MKLNLLTLILLPIFYLSYSNRDEFLSKRVVPLQFRKQEAITFVKFIGKKHDLLTGIMDRLNKCFGLQV